MLPTSWLWTCANAEPVCGELLLRLLRATDIGHGNEISTGDETLAILDGVDTTTLGEFDFVIV